MATPRGTLHIVRNFTDTIANTGVYDVTYTLDDSQAEPHAGEHIRRFASEQELTEFLKKHLRRAPEEVENLLLRLQQDGRARISALQLEPNQLRELRLAA